VKDEQKMAHPEQDHGVNDPAAFGSPEPARLQLPARAGSNIINAAIHKAIQIKKFLASATSVFITHPLNV
jgi:hypothetical protein